MNDSDKAFWFIIVYFIMAVLIALEISGVL
jgi:hypothetical protein